MNRASLPPPPDDLAILSRLTIAATADLRDLAARLIDRVPSLDDQDGIAGRNGRRFRWRSRSPEVSLDHSPLGGDTRIAVTTIDGAMPRLGELAPGTVSIVLPVMHLDRRNHPLRPPRRDGVRHRDAPDIDRRTLVAALERIHLLASVAADPARRLPHDDIPRLRERLTGVAAAAYESADPSLGIRLVTAFSAGADRRAVAIGVDGSLPVGRRDLLPAMEPEWSSSDLPPVLLVDLDKCANRVTLRPPSANWSGGDPMETMRAIGAGRR